MVESDTFNKDSMEEVILLVVGKVYRWNGKSNVSRKLHSFVT